MARSYPGPILVVLLLLNMFYTISMFIVPFSVEHDTLHDLDGYGNTVDNNDEYEHVNPYAHAVYAFGDSQCHQKEDRTFHLNGNQMPMCARCTALFVFSNFGLLLAMMLYPHPSLSRTSLGMLPRKLSEKVQAANMSRPFIVIFLVGMITPLGLDGGLQLVTDYTSTNANRVITGMLAGVAGGMFLGMILNNIWYFVLREGPEDPRGWRTRPGDDKKLARLRKRRRRQWERWEREMGSLKARGPSAEKAHRKGKGKKKGRDRAS